jgi:hypothetical protein
MVDTREASLAVAALVRWEGCIIRDLFDTVREGFMGEMLIHHDTLHRNKDYLQNWGWKEEGQTERGRRESPGAGACLRFLRYSTNQ